MVDLPAQAGALVLNLTQILLFSVYILKSLNRNWFYVGLSLTPENRISQHNLRKVPSTKHYAPFIMIYIKQFESRLRARDYEKFLKIRSNKEKLLKELGYL